MSTVDSNIFNWGDITGTEATYRLFPEISGLDLGPKLELFPGRYWMPWSVPPAPTDLDRLVYKIIASDMYPSLVDSKILEQNGIICPFYAVRLHTLRAAMHGHNSYRAFNREKKIKLEEEKSIWLDRIRLSKRLLREHNPQDIMQIGTIHLLPGDLDCKSWELIEDDRNRGFDKLTEEIGVYTKQIEMISETLDRMDRLRGKASPDLWATPFYIYMGNLWSLLTGKPVPAENSSRGEGPFYEMLRIATRVISGGERSIVNWGQARTLRARFKASPTGEGFRQFENDGFALDYIEVLARRGEDLQNIIIDQHREIPCSYSFICILRAILSLTDKESNPLEIIMKEMVLRPLIVEYNIYSTSLMVQLGWIGRPSDNDLAVAVTELASDAVEGNCVALAVLWAVVLINPGMGGAFEETKVYSNDSGTLFSSLVQDYERREIENKHDEFPYIIEDRVFCAAMNIITLHLDLEYSFNNREFTVQVLNSGL